MSEKPYIVFRWLEWLWALRWRLLLWGGIAIIMIAVGLHDQDAAYLIVGLLLVPALLGLALIVQGALGASYYIEESWPTLARLAPFLMVLGMPAILLLGLEALFYSEDRWPWATEVSCFLIGACVYATAYFTLLNPKPPPERRPVLHHPLHQAEPSPPFEDGRNIAERLPAANPVWGWLAIAALAAIVAFLNYWPLL